MLLVAAAALASGKSNERTTSSTSNPTTSQSTQPAPEPDPEPTPVEAAQDEIVEGLNVLFRSAGVEATAAASEDDLMILSTSKCDRKVLTDLRKALVELKLDPAKFFNTMQCNGGPVLKLR